MLSATREAASASHRLRRTGYEIPLNVTQNSKKAIVLQRGFKVSVKDAFCSMFKRTFEQRNMLLLGLGFVCCKDQLLLRGPRLQCEAHYCLIDVLCVRNKGLLKPFDPVPLRQSTLKTKATRVSDGGRGRSQVGSIP